MKKILYVFWTAVLTVGTIYADSGSTRRGVVCFTFDDYGGKNWVASDAIFKKYDAHATFLISGSITSEKAAIMKTLQSAGHSVGLHTLNHRNASPLPNGWTMEKYIKSQVMPQLEACQKYGIKVRCFAYPNNRHTAESDRELFKYFDYLRAGWENSSKPAFTPVSELKEKMVLGGGGIGKYYKSTPDGLKKLLSRAHELDALIVFFSHNIFPDAPRVHMPTELLEELLKHARELNMNIVGMEELTNYK